jgi:hypothetical protein
MTTNNYPMHIREAIPFYKAWFDRPVYKAQCKTWQVAKELGLCSLNIRSIPGQRDKYTQVARDFIASSVRMKRFADRNLGTGEAA